MKLCHVGFLLGLFLMLGVGVAHASATTGPTIDVIRLQADINPVTADYVVRGLDQAKSDDASAVVIELDTPGGDLGSMTKIVQHMYASTVPTIVYVAPSGAWAGSAGTFITMAADLAAMAPGTAIGAASPVSSSGGDLGKTEKRKVTNFAAAQIAALARDHGHNSKFAVKAVRDAKALGYRDAFNHHVVNLIATSLPQLFRLADGVTVHAPADCPPGFGTHPVNCSSQGRNITFHTRGAQVRFINMDWSENLMLLLTNANLVLLLMSVGTLAIIFELSSPGAILPGIVGVICLAIAFYAIGIIPVNAAGLVLMAFGILLFIADIKMPTHGFLTVGGIIAFALGAVLLFSPSGTNGPQLSPWMVLLTTALMAGFFGFLVRKAIGAQKWSVKTGIEETIGKSGITQSQLNPDGMIYFEGALWQAHAEGLSIERGVEVRIVSASGLTLYVVPAVSLAGQGQTGPELSVG